LLRVLRLAEILKVPVEHVPWCADPRRAIIGADIYVTASRTETYAIATLEALGCGRAIIARRVGNTPAYVTDGVTACCSTRTSNSRNC
jgi:glycosyltransferase involved in cell wall biosynthesis